MRVMMKLAAVGLLSVAVVGCGKAGDQPAASETGAAVPAAAPVATPAAADASASATPVADAGAAPVDFAMCAACHSVKPGVNGIGPSLAGVVGRKSGSLAGYAYSEPFKKLDLNWDEANLDKWLTNPMVMAPGTRMAFPGYADAAKRKAVIDYLKSLK